MKLWKKIGLGATFAAFLLLLILGIRRIQDPTEQIVPEKGAGHWVREWSLKQNLMDGQAFGSAWLFQDGDWLRGFSLEGEVVYERRLSAQEGWSLSDRRMYVYHRSTGKIECYSPDFEELWAIHFLKPIESVFSYNGLLAVGAKTGQTSEQLMILDPEAGQVIANLSSPNTSMILPNQGLSDYYVHGIQMKDGYWRNSILHFDKAGNLMDDLKVNEPVILATRPLADEAVLIVAKRSLALYQDEAVARRIELAGQPQAVEASAERVDCLLKKSNGGELIRLDQDLNVTETLSNLPAFTEMRAYRDVYYVWNQEQWGVIDKESLTYTPGTKSEEAIYELIPVDGALWLVHEYGIDTVYWKGGE
jgi:hypothetical protein